MMVISIIVFSLFCAKTDGHFCGNSCQCVSNTITCREELPTVLPNNVIDVILEGLDFSKYVDKPFDHNSWRPVQRLVLTDAIVDKEILSKRKDYSIRKGLFNNLENLKHLKIESQTYTYTEPNGYSGLSNLEILDLSGCERHSFDALTEALSGVHMPKLNTLRLKGISSSTTRSISLDKRFFLALNNKPISELDLSYTNTNGMDFTAFSSSLRHLQVFKFEHANYLLFHIIIAFVINQRAPTFANIKEYNANYATFPKVAFNLNAILKQQGPIIINKEMILNVKVLLFRQIIPKGQKINITFQEFGDKLCPTVSFEKHSSLEWMVPFCQFDDSYDAVRLDVFDLGDNGIVFLDPLFYDICRNIKVIDLSMNAIGDNINQIGIRAKTRPLNVIKLLLSHNDIKTLDNDILSWIPILDVLDLSHNLLEHFSPFIPESHPLQFLDLSYNRISFIDPGILSKLGTQFPTESIHNSHTAENDTSFHRSINITGNMFQCSCDNKLFIEKLMQSMTIIKNMSLMCFYETDIIPINESVLPKIEHLCTWPKQRLFIIVFSTVFILICFIVIFVIVRRCRTRSKIRHFKMLLRKYKNDLNKPDYPVFLSFASADKHIVHSYVLPRLNKGIQELLETEKVCVATGDLDFLPGFSITGEIIRCVEASRVVIFCVSREFCESGYCKNELVVADYIRTPVILLFLEEIEVTKMPKILQKYFYTSTRCKVTVYNGGRTLVPNWNTLCRSIVQLFDVQD